MLFPVLTFSDVDVDEVDSNGFTPVMWAASYGQLPTVKLLIQHRANINMEVSLHVLSIYKVKFTSSLLL